MGARTSLYSERLHSRSYRAASHGGGSNDGATAADCVRVGAVGADETRGGGSLWRPQCYVYISHRTAPDPRPRCTPVRVLHILPQRPSGFFYPLSLVLYPADSLPRRALPFPG